MQGLLSVFLIALLGHLGSAADEELRVSFGSTRTLASFAYDPLDVARSSFQGLLRKSTAFCESHGAPPPSVQACGRDIAESALSNIARCWTREASQLEEVCYIPLACVSSFVTGGWSIPSKAIAQLSAASTENVLSKIWNYGSATIVGDQEFEQLVRGAHILDGASFISTVVFGPAIYLRYTGLPLLNLNLLNHFYKLPPVRRVLNVVFPEKRKEQDNWILDFQGLLQRVMPPLGAFYGSPAKMRNASASVCTPLILYNSKNTGVKGTPLRWYPDHSAARRLRRIAQSFHPGELSHDTSAFRAAILQRTHDLQGRRAKRILSNVDLVKETLLTAGLVGKVASGVDVITFENTSFWHQVKSMHAYDVVVAPHGNGLSNIVFMRECAIVIELFPYKFASPVFGHLAGQSNIVYREWRKETDEEAPACLKAWSNLTTQECMMQMDCLECGRNAEYITADADGLSKLLESAYHEQQACLRQQ